MEEIRKTAIKTVAVILYLLWIFILADLLVFKEDGVSQWILVGGILGGLTALVSVFTLKEK